MALSTVTKKRRRAPETPPTVPKLFPGHVLLYHLLGRTTIFLRRFACEELPLLDVESRKRQLLNCLQNTTLVVEHALPLGAQASDLGVSPSELSSIIHDRGLFIVTADWVATRLESRKRIYHDETPDGIIPLQSSPRVALSAPCSDALEGYSTMCGDATAAPPFIPQAAALALPLFGSHSMGTVATLPSDTPTPIAASARGRVLWRPAAAPTARAALPLPSASWFTSTPAPSSSIEVLWGSRDGYSYSVDTPPPGKFFDWAEKTHGAWLVVIWHDLRSAFVWHGWHTVEWYVCSHDSALPSAATLCRTVVGDGGRLVQRLSDGAIDKEWVRAAQVCEVECSCASRCRGIKAHRCPDCGGCPCYARHTSTAGVFAPKRWRSELECKRRHFWPSFQTDAAALFRAARGIKAAQAAGRADPLLTLLRHWYALSS